MIIDSHEHLILPTKFQIDKLDQAGIDKAILFCTTPHPERTNSFSELKNEMEALYKVLAGNNTNKANMERLRHNIQEMVQVLHKYPDRFYGFGSVPLGLTLEETVQWIKENVISNGLKGIGEFTPGSDEQVRQLETVFQALEEFPHLPVWVHTFNPVSSNGIKLLMELTQKYPKIQVIYGHMGGYYWMDILDFAKSVPNAFIDLSAAFSTLAVLMAATELPEKCLYSSDAPYGEPLISRQLIEFVSPSSEITDKILGGNILKLIGEENN